MVIFKVFFVIFQPVPSKPLIYQVSVETASYITNCVLKTKLPGDEMTDNSVNKTKMSGPQLIIFPVL